MADITFKRTGPENSKGGVPGELTIGSKTWPTIERGGGYTFVRKGEYTLKMDIKATGRKVQCLRFDHDGIRTHLIHDALNDNHANLAGCIAPGQSKNDNCIKGSAEAMKEVLIALGGSVQGTAKTILVENNITGDETGEQWMRRRQAAKKY
jgi:hypothetical protein